VLRILVTGATDGIGRETARRLLAQGHQVLIHGRNQAKAKQVAADLTRNALPVWGDLSRMREVVALARQVSDVMPVLDVLVNNAGVYEQDRRLTEDGFESTMAVNHFAHFLLTPRLLGSLRAAPSARVVVVASMVHQSGRLDLHDLSFARRYDAYAAYGASKLANVLFTRALAQRLAKDSAVTANALHPGVISTKLLHRGFGAGGAPLEQGAHTSVYLATSPQVQGVSGKYFVDCRESRPARLALDDRLAEELWQVSSDLLASYL
jgi:NAD(P)-dependent dehydrogenase (short-subunit alcohol dehydrogenase family)